MERRSTAEKPNGVCDACGSSRVFITTNKRLYGPDAVNPDRQVIKCGTCRASVALDPTTGKRTGLMCDSLTRSLRINVHNQFDGIWKYGKLSRQQAYRWLADAMNLSLDDCHIGKMTTEQLKCVMRLCQEYSSGEVEIRRKRQEKKDARQRKRAEQVANLERYKRGAKRYY